MAPRLLTQSELSELVKTPVATDETPKVPVDPQTLRIGLGQGGLMGHGDEIEAFFKITF